MNTIWVKSGEVLLALKDPSLLEINALNDKATLALIGFPLELNKVFSMEIEVRRPKNISLLHNIRT
jgi:hypothetical protein